MININRYKIALDCLNYGSLMPAKNSVISDIVKFDNSFLVKNEEMNRTIRYSLTRQFYKNPFEIGAWAYARLIPTGYDGLAYNIQPKTFEELLQLLNAYRMYRYDDFPSYKEELLQILDINYMYMYEDDTLFAKQQDVFNSAFTIFNELEYRTEIDPFTKDINSSTWEIEWTNFASSRTPQTIITTTYGVGFPEVPRPTYQSYDIGGVYYYRTDDYKLKFTYNSDISFMETIQLAFTESYSAFDNIPTVADKHVIDLPNGILTQFPSAPVPNLLGRSEMPSRQICKYRKFTNIQELVDLIQS